MARVKLLISYDGTDYCGWQRQEDHKHGPQKPSLQQTLEHGLEQIFSEKISVSASGRTDAGVHAVAQVGHFDTEKRLPRDLCWALRGYLPPSLVIKKAWQAPIDFHATLSAEKKTYRYSIWNQPRASALLHRYSWWVRAPLDLDFLAETATFLVKKQDFKSFQSTGTPVQSTVREIYSAEWRRKTSEMIEFRVTGSGFLKQMVRNIVGTQLDLCQKGRKTSEMAAILAALDRRAAGTTAPPQGLFLEKVYYPSDLDKRCRRI